MMSARRSIRWVWDHHFSRGLPLAELRARSTSSPRSTPPIRWTTAAPSALHRSVAETAAGLGVDARCLRLADGSAGARLGRDRRARAGAAAAAPRHPLSAARFGVSWARSAHRFWPGGFAADGARALLAGMAAHSMLPLNRPPTAAFALVLLGLGHTVGWPVVRGGSQAITDAMAAYLRSLGGVIELEPRGALDGRCAGGGCGAVRRHAAPAARDRGRPAAVTVPRCARALPLRAGRVQARLRAVGTGAVDRAEECRRATTVHLGGSFEQIAAAERIAVDRRPLAASVRAGRPAEPDRPDAGAAGPPHPVGVLPRAQRQRCRHDRRVEGQIERFAPGFGELVLARSARGPAEIEADNPNYIGGDINGGLGRPAPGARPAGAAPLALHDAESPDLPVLVVDAAGWRCARYVWLSRRASRLEPIAAFAIVTVWNCINGTVYFIHQVSPFRAGHTEGDQVGFIREQTVQ